MLGKPAPAPLTAIQHAALARGPIAFVSVAQAVDAVAQGVVQVDILTAVTERTRPIPNDILDARIFALKRRAIRDDHQVSACGEAHVRESEINPIAETPAVEI